MLRRPRDPIPLSFWGDVPRIDHGPSHAELITRLEARTNALTPVKPTPVRPFLCCALRALNLPKRSDIQPLLLPCSLADLLNPVVAGDNQFFDRLVAAHDEGKIYCAELAQSVAEGV